MATVKPLKPDKPVDHDVAYEPVMLALSRARALAWFLEHLGDDDSELRHVVESSSRDVPECTVGWVQQAIADELRRAHDTIEIEYRKLVTNLLMKELAVKEVEAFLKSTDGA
jgi:hypothetical protein